VTGSVDWIPALVALAVGVLGGGVLAWRVYRSGRAPSPASEALVARDLRAKTDALLAQLRELDDTAAKRSPEQLARERHALELEAALALRDLERVPAPQAATQEAAAEAVAGAAPAASPEAIPAAAGDGRALRGFLWATGTVAVLGLMLVYVSRSANERREGGSVTGSLPGEERRGADEDPELAQLEAAVVRTPGDVETRLLLARRYLAQQDLMAVWNHTKAVLEIVPGEPRALGYQALVRLAMGQGDLAEQMLKQALADRPDFLEGHLHLAIVYAQTGKPQQAEEVIAGAMRQFPGQEETLRRLRDEIRSAAGQEPPAELRDPHAGVGPPPAPATASAAADAVRGTIDLAPGLADRAGPGVVFVVVREAGASGGPPLAARRIDATRFPVPFEIGPADSMMGGELPEELLVEARLDRDGDAASRDPSDPLARRDGVRKGSSGVALVLEAPRP
jgi:cytochrome c-type biogenesis protein CcmH